MPTLNATVIDISGGGTTVFEFSRAELACRILEGLVGRSRPAGASASSALLACDEQTRCEVLAAADSAWAYFQEGMQNGVRPS